MTRKLRKREAERKSFCFFFDGKIEENNGRDGS